jgi:hypothetical protein
MDRRLECAVTFTQEDPTINLAIGDHQVRFAVTVQIGDQEDLGIAGEPNVHHLLKGTVAVA